MRLVPKSKVTVAGTPRSSPSPSTTAFSRTSPASSCGLSPAAPRRSGPSARPSGCGWRGGEPHGAGRRPRSGQRPVRLTARLYTTADGRPWATRCPSPPTSARSPRARSRWSEGALLIALAVAVRLRRARRVRPD
ncbi:hypothetical protein NKH77_31315 [Streptomyces sp. M19]